MEGITHNNEKQRFEIVVDGVKAYVVYHIEDGKLDIRHTIVPEEIGGRGIASALVKATYDYAIEHNRRCVATCSYAMMWLKRHPEYHGEESADHVPGGCAL